MRIDSMKGLLFVLALLLVTGCQRYKVENGRWALISYDEGVGRRVRPIEAADAASFQPIDREYAKDKERVYWLTSVIHGADPATFTPLGHSYAKDKQKVFSREREIAGADPNSFVLVDGNDLLSRDKRDFYFGNRSLGVKDLGTFKVINDGWAKDAVAYYTTPGLSQAGRVECDYATMKILNHQYAVDRDRAYYYGTPIEGVDVATFRVTGPITARDRNQKYRGARVDWLK